MLDAAELRRASASDAVAVAQYLRTIDSDELDGLLDAFADAERKKSGDAHEWRALVHVLLRTRATRQRTATRVLQSLWRGHAGEMEALRWVSEISLAYMASAADSSDASDSASSVAAELRVVLQIALQFVRDAMAAASTKALPQLLALVPVLLHLLVETSTRASSGDGSRTTETTTDAAITEPDVSTSIVHEHVVQLLELPWDVRTVPFLLELLREHTTLVSRPGWTQLRQSVEQLIAPTAGSEVPTDGINPLVRECLLLAASRSDARDEAAAWIQVARVLIRRLPAHMRQESEFNVQMSLHQYPPLASLICDVLLTFTSDSSAIETKSARLDASDAVLLLHVIRASKPLLHHHLIGTTLAASANDRDSVVSKAQRLILSVLRDGPAVAATSVCALDDKHIKQAATAILEFGGRQLHARVWKAQLLHELARAWSNSGDADVGSIVIEVIFCTVPDVREEILQTLLDSSRVASQSERAFRQLRSLVVNHKSLVAPYRQLLEDWLSTLAGLSQHSELLDAGYSAVATLVTSLKDFYNFSMVLLRKQLSSPHASERRTAVNIWCSWLQDGLALDTQQEEEVVLAIKHAVQLTHDRGWTFQRLVCIFQARGVKASLVNAEGRQLRESSLAEFQRIFACALEDFIVPASHADDRDDTEPDDEDESGSETEHESPSGLRRHRLRQFTVSTLDACYNQNSSVASALQLGGLLESIVDGLLGVEHAIASRGASKSTNPFTKDAHLGHEVVRWIDIFVRHRDEFFVWVSSGGAQLRVGDTRFVWSMAARVSLGCAFCNLALRRQVEMHQFSSSTSQSSVWELLESQMSITRLWRKFSATTPMADTVLAQKDNQLDSNVLQLAASTLSPLSSELLSRIVEILKGLATDQATHQANSGASLDGILFLLDAYVFKLSTQNTNPGDMRVTSEVEALVTMYATVAEAKFNRAVEVDEHVSAPANGALFTTYGESLAAQYPKSMRHLVVPENPTALTVTLDGRAAEEVLSRVCVALAKTVGAITQSKTLFELVRGLGKIEQAPSGSGNESHRVGSLNSVALRLLNDVKCVMDNDAYAKFRLAAVALVRKLVDFSTKQADANIPGVSCDHEQSSGHVTDVVADAAYELLCDHVVNQPPLLRALLALSFPLTSSFTPPNHADIDRAGAVLSACGFHNDELAADRDVQDKTPNMSDAKETETKQPGDRCVRGRRRRLRQIRDEDDEEEDETSDGTPSVEGDEPRDEPGDTDQEPASAQEASVSNRVQRLPRLTTKTSQSTALVAVLSFLESAHSVASQSMMSFVKSQASRRSQRATQNTAGLLVRTVKIQTLLASTVFSSADGSWISVRTLSKLSNVVESAAKIGKHCCASSTAPKGSTDMIDRDALVQSFISSIAVTVRGRAWLALLRDATAQAAAKSKLSATILKLDVFLLGVPTLVATLMKADALPMESKRSLRVFLSTIEADLALSTSMASSRSTSGADAKKVPSSVKRHLVGVVPIIQTKRRKRLRSRHAFIDSCLAEEDGDDAFADLEDFIA